MEYLVDTDWVIHYLNGHEGVQERLDRLAPVRVGDHEGVSCICDWCVMGRCPLCPSDISPLLRTWLGGGKRVVAAHGLGALVRQPVRRVHPLRGRFASTRPLTLREGDGRPQGSPLRRRLSLCEGEGE